MLHAEHGIVIAKPWEECFALCSALDRWPEFMPAVRSAKIVQQSDNEQEIELTAEFGERILTWRSRRQILAGSRMIRFWSLTPRYPLHHLAGEWSFEPAAGGATRVRVLHEFELADPSRESEVRAGIRRNMMGDLEGMKQFMEKEICH